MCVENLIKTTSFLINPASQIVELMMFSQLRGGLLNAGGGGRNGAQEQDDRNQQGAHAASSGITGEEFIQWQQRLIGARQGKEEKLRQDTLVMESSGRRVTQLKTDNEQLAGKEEMLVEESKMEEVVLNDTEVQLDFLEEQLHEASALGGMVKQMQEQQELVKVDQDLRLRVMEKSFRQIQVLCSSDYLFFSFISCLIIHAIISVTL